MIYIYILRNISYFRPLSSIHFTIQSDPPAHTSASWMDLAQESKSRSLGRKRRTSLESATHGLYQEIKRWKAKTVTFSREKTSTVILNNKLPAIILSDCLWIDCSPDFEINNADSELLMASICYVPLFDRFQCTSIGDDNAQWHESLYSLYSGQWAKMPSSASLHSESLRMSLIIKTMGSKDPNYYPDLQGFHFQSCFILFLANLSWGTWLCHLQRLISPRVCKPRSMEGLKGDTTPLVIRMREDWELLDNGICFLRCAWKNYIRFLWPVVSAWMVSK